MPDISDFSIRLLYRLASIACTTLFLHACGGADANEGAATSLASDSAVTSATEPTQFLGKAAELNAQDLEEARLEAESMRLDPQLNNTLPASIAAFQSGRVAQMASASLLPVYRFFNTQTSAHFFTASTNERDAILANMPQFRFEGEAFSVSSGPSAGLDPVYRFFNTQNGVHHYTISESERTFIEANLPQYRLEGVAYYASQVAGAGLAPLYRFYLPRTGTHFYTASEAERQQLQNTQAGTYNFEGVGYYVLGSGFNLGPSFAQQAFVKAANAEAIDKFGYSVAIDGDTMVVGAPFERSSQTTITNGSTASVDNSAPLSGAAYVYTRIGNTWIQQAYLKAPNADAYDQFGTSVAISGDTIVVGAQYEHSNQTSITNGSSASNDNSTGNAGAAYVFVRSGSTWSQQAYIKAPNAETGDHFGHSVAISGDTIVVGSYHERSTQTTITNGSTASADNSGWLVGAAYVFVRNGTTWGQQAYLKAPNAESQDFFGFSVAVSGDTVVVGAWAEDSNQTTIRNASTASADNSALNAGAAYVFTRSGNIWSQQAYLKAPNAEALDNFGYSVAISGSTILVGARGESSNQTTVTNGSTASIINSAGGAGAAYVFTRSGGIWSQQAYLKASNTEANDNFGAKVALSGDTIVVGADQEDSSQTTITNGSTASANNDAPQAGASYVFVRSGDRWRQVAYLKAPNATANDMFGGSVAISGSTIVVGAEGESSNQTTITNGNTASSDTSAVRAGAAYVFSIED